MQFRDLINDSYQTFIDQLERANILLLHPNSRYRSVVVANLINDPSINTYYYSLSIEDITLKAFIAALIREISHQDANFGRHLSKLPETIFDNIEQNMPQLIDATVRELQDLNDQPYLLILDEYDRSDGADYIHLYLESLADVLPQQCKIVLNSRTLPRLSWIAMVAKNQAALILDKHVIQQNLYHLNQAPSSEIEVYALGQGLVNYNGARVDGWEGHLPRLLLFFALDRPVVTRSEICDAFWPSLELEQAVNVFHVTKRRLHKALGIDVLVHNENYYQVSSDYNIYYDVMDFIESLMKGRDAEGQESFDGWQHAVELYRGPFLQGHNEQWITSRRAAFRFGYMEALVSVGQEWAKRDRKELALKSYNQAINEDYTRQDIHRQILSLYGDMGRRSEVVAHYQQLEKSFRDQKMPLESETQQLYNSIMA